MLLAPGMTLRETFARNLRHFRHSKRLSQEKVAAEADVTREYLSALERAAYSASIDVIERLAKALEVEPSRLLDKSIKRDRVQ